MAESLNEQWRAIPETLGLYEISSEGNVRRTAPLRNLKPSEDGTGYFRDNLSILGKVTLRYIAPLVLETAQSSKSISSPTPL